MRAQEVHCYTGQAPPAALLRTQLAEFLNEAVQPWSEFGSLGPY